MIVLHTWTTPNGFKASIALEEMGLPYKVRPVNIGADEQFHPDFLKISPNNKIPAIVDEETGISVFETGAILVYLAEKTGKFLPASGEGRYKVLEWLNWQMGGLGPMFGQLGHFAVFAPEKVPYALNRYTNEAKRLLGVLETQLSKHAYVAGDDFTIADMAIYPWINTLRTFYQQEALLTDTPHIRAWFDKVGTRPAVQKGMTVGKTAT
ncbi:glutathione binding-like protein [Asticcacaulis sp. DXS10W]|uniref:Glutathione binding-like protein n=1 Tax=Asticcacaulis currens TaxID=2984210 RepID=A0ABT5ICN7_9CAUL|nr:glutathione S-transferase C-terminal domain-containing protein [Asticcacaulis currens]MDC7693952.1 glutathione binding-like protein [Asticcacaulis currens]